MNLDADGTSVSFEVQNHAGGVPDGGIVGRGGANCVAGDASVPLSYIRERARAGEMREKMTAVVAEATASAFSSRRPPNTSRRRAPPNRSGVLAAGFLNKRWESAYQTTDLPSGITFLAKGN